MLRIGIVVACLLFCSVKVFSQKSFEHGVKNEGLKNEAVSVIESIIDFVSYEEGRHSLVVYPMAGYSPRTKFHIGVMPVWRIKPRADRECEYYRPTTLAPSVKVSSSGMYEIEFDAMGMTRNSWMFISKFQHLFLPDEFYGIGNYKKAEPYSEMDITRFEFKNDILKGINKKWFLGVRLDVNYSSFKNKTGPLLTPDVEGYHGGWANGLGPGFAFDTRNDQLYPAKGWFIQFSSAVYSKAFGSDYDFLSSTFDVRKYISLKNKESILALQAYISGTDGDVPFYKLSQLGGSRLLRGISHPYKYMDKHAWYMQAEWRKELWWRLGCVLFTGTGKVSPSFLEKPFADMHVVGGTGLRFKVLPDEGLNLRIDFGMSNKGDSGFYFTIREAF